MRRLVHAQASCWTISKKAEAGGRTILYGRSHPDVAPRAAQSLDETGAATRHPSRWTAEALSSLGAYNWATDEVIWLVMDNASYHHSAAAEATLAFFEDDGLIPCWLPPHCSNLNPIERFWWHLKDFAFANKLLLLCLTWPLLLSTAYLLKMMFTTPNASFF
ncbi:MAG: transposase [Caldilineaceae bacterium]